MEYFPVFNTLQLSQEVNELLLRLNETPENFTGRIIFMSMFNEISWGSRDNKVGCESHAKLVSLKMQEDLEQDNGHFSVLVQRKSGVLSVKTVHKVNGTKMAELMMITFRERGQPVFRATSPLSRGELKSKGGGKLSIHYCADQETITTVFRTITFVNQLSLYGAVAEMCEECESCHAGRPVVGEQYT